MLATNSLIIEWLAGVLHFRRIGEGKSGQNVNLTTHLELVSRLRMDGPIFLFLCMLSRLLQGDIFLYVLYIILKTHFLEKEPLCCYVGSAVCFG